MMVTFKSTPLEISVSLPKSLYDRVEKKWQFSLAIEKKIRKAQLAQAMNSLDKKMMAKAMNKYKGRISPKYRAFKILRKKIEEVVIQSTLLWKDIYGLSTKATKKKQVAKKKKNDNVEEPKKSDEIEKGEKEKDDQEKDDNVDGTDGTT